MFRVKICGITNVDDGLTAVRAGADALGLNFYVRSPRCVTPETARKIVEAVPAGITKVGLFVNSTADEVCRLFDDLRLDLIQLHGVEPPEFLSQLGDRPVMRALHVGPKGLPPVIEYLARCRTLNVPPTLVMLDALVAGEYGGTGQRVDWEAARQYVAQGGMPPLVLAGGLTPENVDAAIRAVRPAAVDVASGVESSPGRKNSAAMAAFVEAARAAFAHA